MNLMKIILMAFGLYFVMPAFAGTYEYETKRGRWGWEGGHRSYRGPGAEYCHTRWCQRKYGYGPEYRSKRTSVRETPYGTRRETTEKSAKMEREWFGLGAPTGVVEKKEVKKVEYQ